MTDAELRKVRPGDLPVFFEHGSDPPAVWMAAFTAEDPADRDAFTARWQRILADATVAVRTIDRGGAVLGHVLSYRTDGRLEVSYWIGREHWGQGVATRALAEFLRTVATDRPVHARVAADNAASRRVLERCGFVVVERMRGFANARGEEIEELLMRLDGAVAYDEAADAT